MADVVKMAKRTSSTGKKNRWDDIFRNQEAYRYYSLSEPHEDMEKISASFREHDVRKILDLGCGTGRNLIFLSRKGFEMQGIDLSKNAIAGIRKICNNIPEKNKTGPTASKAKLDAGSRIGLKTGDIFSRLPFDDDSFDAIISVQVLQHSDEKGIIHAISEMKRVLKPGGLIFITVCGRISRGKVRHCLVKTAKKISERTYIPTCGEERGMTHFIYDKKTLLRHYSGFGIIRIWKDNRDYYCLLAENRK